MSNSVLYLFEPGGWSGASSLMQTYKAVRLDA